MLKGCHLLQMSHPSKRMTSMASAFNPDTLYGFYELDAKGTVLYARTNDDEEIKKDGLPVTGQDFFAEVFNSANAAVLRNRFMTFVIGKITAENFMFDCEVAGRFIPLRVLLARMLENNYRSESVFYLDIKPY